MKVQLTFDTELEKTEDLVKLRDWVQEIISKRSGNPPQQSAPVQQVPIQTQQRPAQTQQPSNQTRTSGGSSVVPYEDMSGLLSRIASGEKLR